MKKVSEFKPGRFYENGYTREQALMSVPVGWHPLVHEIFDKIDLAKDKRIVVDQVKEKWGVLRVYTSPMDEEMDAFIIATELKSFKICNECGKDGVLSKKDGRYIVVCKEHGHGYEPVKS